MMRSMNQRIVSIFGVLAMTMAAISPVPSARANVYATDVKLNGGTANVPTPQGGGVVISYILNEPATAGATIKILSGATVVRSIAVAAGNPGALRGTNSVVWDGKDTGGQNVAPGTYSITVTAAATGFSGWTQTSSDADPGNHVANPRGIAVDRNITSPYYGRIFVGNAAAGPDPNNDPRDAVGILKLNADGSPADEGGFSTGGYDWAGDGFSPWKIEVSADDYVYINDWTGNGEIYRWDPTLSPASQLHVLRSDNWGNGGNVLLSGPSIVGTGTNTQIWVADATVPGGLGILKYGITTNFVCASNDVGETVVGIGGNNDLGYAPYDVAVGANGLIFTIQFFTDPGNPAPRVLRFPAYDPAANGNQPELTANWAVGGTNDTYGGASGIAVAPSAVYVAVAFSGIEAPGGHTNANTKVLFASNGAVSATLDLGRAVNNSDVAWDAVGNLYYTDGGAGVWRAYSPRGVNQSTTPALATVQVTGSAQPPDITGLTISSGMATISFTGAASDTPSAFTLQSSALVSGPFSATSGATVSQISPGVFRATVATVSSAQYYRIAR